MLALALALVSLASAAEPDLEKLAPSLAAVEDRVHLPIVVATTDPTMISKLNELDRAHDEMSLVVVHLDAAKPVDTQMKRTLSRRAMRCGVYVEQKEGVWNLMEFGRCGTPTEAPKAADPAPAPAPAPAAPVAPQSATEPSAAPAAAEPTRAE